MDKDIKECFEDYIEEKISKNIRELWELFNKLEQTHPSDIGDFQHGIHELQKVIGMRELRRLMPNKYPTYVKIDGEWECKDNE